MVRDSLTTKGGSADCAARARRAAFGHSPPDQPMRRAIIAILLVLHGLGHSAAGVWAMSLGPPWAVVPLWLIAEVGFVAAGLGLAGVPGLRASWQPIAFFAGVSSVALLASFGTLALVTGLLIDVLLLVLATAIAERSPELDPVVPNGRRRRGAIAAAAVAWAFPAWLPVVVTLRPWHAPAEARPATPSLLGIVLGPARLLGLDRVGVSPPPA
jgi:hypothetical protein